MFIKNNSKRTTLSLLWITVLFLMVFADIFSIIIELESGNTIQIPMEVKYAMVVASFMVSVPILMIVLSWILVYRSSRFLNIIAGVFTIVFVIGGGSMMPHYWIMAGLEVLLLFWVLVIAYNWKEESHI